MSAERTLTHQVALADLAAVSLTEVAVLPAVHSLEQVAIRADHDGDTALRDALLERVRRLEAVVDHQRDHWTAAVVASALRNGHE
jgi:hypothetical protein